MTVSDLRVGSGFDVHAFSADPARGLVLGGVPMLASFENMAKVEAAIGGEADPVQRLGALGVSIVEDAERLWLRLRLTNAEHQRLASMGDRICTATTPIPTSPRPGIC